MGMFAISKEGEVALSFKNDINLNEFFKPDQLTDATTQQSTTLKRRKVRNLKLQTTLSFKYMVSENSCSKEEVEDLFSKQNTQKPELMFSPTSSPDLELAVLMIQKVYKSYRIRRNLADCAIVCEELWWKDSVISADRCSISNFDSDKSEKTISWAKARMMAAKVGKGLSKDDKAQKLALRHWLEAIDPRHRYGHNLHFYYEVWFRSLSKQSFFYWLDVGDGKEVDLKEACPREQLQMQRIKYLGPEERRAYEVVVEGGRLVYRQSKELVHTTEESKWIFVLSTSRILYVGKKEKGQFQHSSFLAGGATIASGRLVAHHGVLLAIWPYSGHYRPTEKNFMEFICFLEEHQVDMTNVKKDPTDEDVPPSKPENEELPFEYIESNIGSSDSATANNNGKENLCNFGSNVEGSVEENKPMSSKWSTGVGPRIGCVREYPEKFQVQALEQLNLSPRVNNATFAGKAPIPSPRPSTKHLSPRLVNMGLPSPIVL